MKLKDEIEMLLKGLLKVFALMFSAVLLSVIIGIIKEVSEKFVQKGTLHENDYILLALLAPLFLLVLIIYRGLKKFRSIDRSLRKKVD